MSGDAARETISFLARSEHRVAVLRSLADGPRTRRALHETTGISQPTLGRILGDFEGRGWVARQGRAFALTSTAAMVHEEFEALLTAVETVRRVGEAFARLPPDEIEGLDLRALGDATVHHPEPGDTLSHIRRMETV